MGRRQPTPVDCLALVLAIAIGVAEAASPPPSPSLPEIQQLLRESSDAAVLAGGE